MKILWAVDAFEEESHLHQNLTRIINGLVDRSHAQVELVYILTPAELNLSPEIFHPWLAQYRPASELALQRLSTQSGISGVVSQKVITLNSVTLSKSVEALLEYARVTHPDVIVVGTHARSGVPRFFLGSFAETLMTHASFPVLTVNPLAESSQWNSILFPTDLGEHSRQLFRYVIHLAQQLQAQVTVFHCLPNPVEPVIQSGVFLLGGGWVPLQNYLDQDRDQKEKRLQAWSDWAIKSGVNTDYQMGESHTNMPHAILSLAREKKSDLIVMAAQSGPVEAALIGSIARQVVRHAHCPVWLYHYAGILPLKKREEKIAA